MADWMSDLSTLIALFIEKLLMSFSFTEEVPTKDTQTHKHTHSDTLNTSCGQNRLTLLFHRCSQVVFVLLHTHRYQQRHHCCSYQVPWKSPSSANGSQLHIVICKTCFYALNFCSYQLFLSVCLCTPLNDCWRSLSCQKHPCVKSYCFMFHVDVSGRI